MQISQTIASASYDLGKVPAAAERFRDASQQQSQSVADAQELHDAFSSFVGQTFFGQMLKAMRSTVDKPAYFHGGRAEEMFQGRLDQQLVDEWSEQTGDRFAEPMFEQQFPKQAKLLREAKQQSSTDSLDNLNSLRRF